MEAGLTDHVWSIAELLEHGINLLRRHYLGHTPLNEWKVIAITGQDWPSLCMGSGHYLSPMKKELSQKQILAVRCPTCGAAPGEKCTLSTGQPRTGPHLDRRLIAAE